MNDSTDNSLGPEGEAAWQAYLAMGKTKRIYFGFLQELDQKYDKNESPSIAENLKMEELLADHDVNVKGFNEAMAKVTDAGDRELLMKKLTQSATSFEAQ